MYRSCFGTPASCPANGYPIDVENAALLRLARVLRNNRRRFPGSHVLESARRIDRPFAPVFHKYLFGDRSLDEQLAWRLGICVFAHRQPLSQVLVLDGLFVFRFEVG